MVSATYRLRQPTSSPSQSPAVTALPKGEPRALPEAFSLLLKLQRRTLDLGSPFGRAGAGAPERACSPRGASGAANAVCRYCPTCENGVQKRPQAFLDPEIKNNISLAYAQSNAERIPNRPTQQGSCGLFYPFSGTKPTRSLMTSPPMIRPATEGTKALEPGTVRRAVHLRWVPGGQMQ